MFRRLLLGLVTAIALTGWVSAQAADPVRIGFSISETGLFAPGAAKQIKSYDLWRELVNAKGGLDVAGTKRPVEFVKYDDQSAPANAVKIYEKLITDDKVDLLFPPFGTVMHLAIVPLLERYKFPMVANTASSVHIREIKPGNIWFTSPSIHDKWAEELVKLAKQAGVSRLALLSNAIPPANEVRRFIIPELEKAKIEIVVNEVWPPSINDMTAVLSQVKKAAPDGVIVLSLPNDSVLYTRQANELGIDAKFQFVAIGPAGAAYRKMFGPKLDGIVMLGHWTPERKEWPQAKEFYDAYVAKYNEPPDYLDSALSYISCQVTEQAVAKAGLDLDKLRETISTGTFETINGPIRFKGVENAVLPVSFLQHQGGKIELIWPSSLATAQYKPRSK